MKHFTNLCARDMALVDRLRERLAAANRTETIRRALITLESLLAVQDAGGQIVLCKKGQPDKVIWFL